MQNSFKFPQLHRVWANPVVVVWHDGLIADGKNCVMINGYPENRIK